MADLSVSAFLSVANRVIHIINECMTMGQANEEDIRTINELTIGLQSLIAEFKRLVISSGVAEQDDASRTIAETEEVLKKAKRIVDFWFPRTSFKDSKKPDDHTSCSKLSRGKNGRIVTIAFRIAYSVTHRKHRVGDAIGQLTSCRDRLHRLNFLLPYQLSSTLCRLSPYLKQSWQDIADRGGCRCLSKDDEIDSSGEWEYLRFGDGVRYETSGKFDRCLAVSRGSLGNIIVSDPEWWQHTSWIYHMLCDVPVSIVTPSPLPTMKQQPPMPVGLLRCTGVSKGSNNTRDLLFDFPNSSAFRPRTLRDILVSGDMENHSLGDRIFFARTLVTAVVLVHSMGIVHKNIRPESIVIFEESHSVDGRKRLGTPYLLGFDQSRPDEGKSGANDHAKVDKLVAELYVHPEIYARHNPHSIKYKMGHDMYSLGVCLLEIALWCSLFEKHPGSQHLLKAVSKIDALQFDKVPCRTAGDKTRKDVGAYRKEFLVKIARTEIPPVLGDGFADVVVACLTCDSTIIGNANNESSPVSGGDGASKRLVPAPIPADPKSVSDLNWATRKAKALLINMKGKLQNGSAKFRQCLMRDGVSASVSDSEATDQTLVKSAGVVDSKDSPERRRDQTAEEVEAKTADLSGMDSFDKVLQKLYAKRELSGGALETVYLIRNVLRRLESISLDLPQSIIPAR